MPSHASWLEFPYIMEATYEGRLTVDDFESVMSVCLDALREHPVYFLVDISKTTANPLNISLIPSVRALVTHPNTRAFGWVGANRFARIMVPTFVRSPFRFCETRAEALAYLHARVLTEIGPVLHTASDIEGQPAT